MMYRLIGPPESVTGPFDIDSLFDGDFYAMSKVINDWGESARAYFVIEPDPYGEYQL